MQGPDCIRFERDADRLHIDFQTWGVAAGDDSGVVDKNIYSSKRSI
jgi:hypothetical protein